MGINGKIGQRPNNPSKDHLLSRQEKEQIEAERHSPNGGLRAIQAANARLIEAEGVVDFEAPI